MFKWKIKTETSKAKLMDELNFGVLLQELEEKTDEKNELQNRINKATEILLDTMEDFIDAIGGYPKVYDELYKTLRGEDNERLDRK